MKTTCEIVFMMAVGIALALGLFVPYTDVISATIFGGTTGAAGWLIADHVFSRASRKRKE